MEIKALFGLCYARGIDGQNLREAKVRIFWLIYRESDFILFLLYFWYFCIFFASATPQRPSANPQTPDLKKKYVKHYCHLESLPFTAHDFHCTVHHLIGLSLSIVHRPVKIMFVKGPVC